MFVDDEPMFLESLRRVLYKQRKTWDISFAVGAEAALEQLATTQVDVVVSDMRMPRIDGAEFLRRVQEIDPGAARLALSGYADADMLERAAPFAQQYLAKPCPTERLQSTLERICELQRALDNRSVREWIGRVGRLPTLPRSHWQLSDLLRKPELTMEEVIAIVGCEPTMSAKLLQLANAPYFRQGGPITSVADAVAILGLDLVRRLPMMLNTFSEGDVRLDGFSLPDLQQGSIATARLAARFAETPEEADLATTAGLVHDIGRILLLREAPDEMARVFRHAVASGRAVTEVERELLGTSHAKVGAYVLGMWGLPLPVVEAVAYHHTMPAGRRADLKIAALVHAADVLLEQALASRLPHPVEELDMPALDALGLSSRLPAWREMAGLEAENMGMTSPGYLQ